MSIPPLARLGYCSLRALRVLRLAFLADATKLYYRACIQYTTHFQDTQTMKEGSRRHDTNAADLDLRRRVRFSTDTSCRRPEFCMRGRDSLGEIVSVRRCLKQSPSFNFRCLVFWVFLLRLQVGCQLQSQPAGIARPSILRPKHTPPRKSKKHSHKRREP